MVREMVYLQAAMLVVELECLKVLAKDLNSADRKEEY